MGFLSFLFGPPEPKGTAPRMPLRRFSPMTRVPPTDYTVIDLETTGLDACTCEILEIGAIRYRNHKKEEEFHTYIRPEGSIPATASCVNHITWRKVASAPSLSDISESFLDFIGNDSLVGFNIPFDIKFIQTRLGIDITNTSFDVLPFVRETFPELPSYKLDNLRQDFVLGGVPHSALGDCIATATLLQKCLDSPAGQCIASQAAEYQLQFEREEEERRKYHEEVKAKKAAERASSPTQKELRDASKKMTGDNYSYIGQLQKILQESGRDITILTDDGYCSGYQTLKLGGFLVFGVKTSGNLKYIVFDLPASHFAGGFLHTPSSMAEGSNATRVFLSSPGELIQLGDQILTAYDAAASCYQSQQDEIKSQHEKFEQEFAEGISDLISSLTPEEKAHLRDVLHKDRQL